MKNLLFTFFILASILKAGPASAVTVFARTKVSCQTLMENFPSGFLANSENVDRIIEDPKLYLNPKFNFQDAVTLINDLLKKNNLDEIFRTETLESVYHQKINIINVRQPFAKGLVRNNIFWDNEKPETTEKLVARLLDAVTIIYQTKIPRLGPIKILTQTPNGFLRETEKQTIAMLRLETTLLEILGRSDTYQRKLRLSKPRQVLSTPLSLLMDRQRAQLRFVRRTPELTRALNDGDLIALGRMVALRFGPQTYVRWFWQVINDTLIVTTVATAVSIGPTFVQSVVKMLKVADQAYGLHDDAGVQRAENFFASSDGVRREILSENLDRISTQDLNSAEAEYVKSLRVMIQQPPLNKP